MITHIVGDVKNHLFIMQNQHGIYKQQQDNLNEQARIAQGNVANNIARQQYEQGQYSLLNQALMQSMPDLNSMFYVDGNGKLVTRPGQENNVSEFYTDALRKYDTMDNDCWQIQSTLFFIIMKGFFYETLSIKKLIFAAFDCGYLGICFCRTKRRHGLC